MMNPVSATQLNELLRSIPAATWNAQRWFGGKGRTLQSVSLHDFAVFNDGQEFAVLVLAEMIYSDGPPETYFVPLVIRHVDSAANGIVLGRITVAGEGRLVTDGLAETGVCQQLIDQFRTSAVFTGERGRFLFRTTPSFKEIIGDENAVLPVTFLPPMQSNTLVRYGERAIFKCFRRPVAGINPDVEVGTFLTTQTSFKNIALLSGVLEYVDQKNECLPLAVLQSFIPNQGNAWDSFQRLLHDYVHRLWFMEGMFTDDLLERMAADAERLGERTGQLHAALASSNSQADFAPRKASAPFIEYWKKVTKTELDKTLEIARARLPALPPEWRPAAQSFLNHESKMAAQLEACPTDSDWHLVRIHGDYHLGQVLITGETDATTDFFIIDFEGEPLRPLAERRAKHCVLKDVAGMLRSFNYAGYAALFTAEKHGVPANRLEQARSDWERKIRSRFMRGYLAEAGKSGVPLLPSSTKAAEHLLSLFELEKALYELRYELDNRPDWARIPLSGIQNLVPKQS